jgi:hypothetical protein
MLNVVFAGRIGKHMVTYSERIEVLRRGVPGQREHSSLLLYRGRSVGSSLRSFFTPAAYLYIEQDRLARAARLEPVPTVPLRDPFFTRAAFLQDVRRENICIPPEH